MLVADPTFLFANRLFGDDSPLAGAWHVELVTYLSRENQDSVRVSFMRVRIKLPLLIHLKRPPMAILLGIVSLDALVVVNMFDLCDFSVALVVVLDALDVIIGQTR